MMGNTVSSTCSRTRSARRSSRRRAPLLQGHVQRAFRVVQAGAGILGQLDEPIGLLAVDATSLLEAHPENPLGRLVVKDDRSCRVKEQHRHKQAARQLTNEDHLDSLLRRFRAHRPFPIVPAMAEVYRGEACSAVVRSARPTGYLSFAKTSSDPGLSRKPIRLARENRFGSLDGRPGLSGRLETRATGNEVLRTTLHVRLSTLPAWTRGSGDGGWLEGREGRAGAEGGEGWPVRNYAARRT
jgi:hypothetical protein